MNSIFLVLLAIPVMLALTVLFFLLGCYVSQRFTHGKFNVKNLFKNFEQKVVMTFGLGFLYVISYLLLIACGYVFLKENGIDLLFLTENITAILNFGILFFLANILLIILFRKIVKDLYNSIR